MSKRFRKAIISSIISIILIILCLTTCAFAWFSLSTAKNIDGPAIEINASGMAVNYEVYKYENDEFIEATNSSGAFNLRAYDSIIQSRNNNISIILKLFITGQPILDHQDITIIITYNNTPMSGMYLSNVVYFKFATLNINSNDPETIYTCAINSFDQNNNKYTFINNNDKNSISYIISNYENYIVNNALEVYVQINYDQDLVESSGTISLEDFNSEITYTSDITTLSIFAGDN